MIQQSSSNAVIDELNLPLCLFYSNRSPLHAANFTALQVSNLIAKKYYLSAMEIYFGSN